MRRGNPPLRLDNGIIRGGRSRIYVF